jgi:hypothetical protein
MFRRKIKMKKALAVLLCVAMLFTVLSVNAFAETKAPSVSVVANATSENQDDVSFAIKLADFDSLKGFDLKVTVDGGLALKDEEPQYVNVKDIAGTSYKVDGNTLHVVGLTTDKEGTVIITVAATLNDKTKNQSITIALHDLAKSGDALYTYKEEYSVENGKIVPYIGVSNVPVEENATVVEQPVAAEGEYEYFIPFGSVYESVDGAYKFVAKENNGSFDVAGKAVSVSKFKVPEGGIGTFGVQRPTVEGIEGYQFGNYTNNYNAANTYGSLIIFGDWQAYRDNLLKANGYSDKEILEMIYDEYVAKKGSNKGEILVGFTADNVKIAVTKYNQKNYMWKTSDANGAKTDILEYAVAVREVPKVVSNYCSNTICSVGAYSIAGDEVTIGTDIRSKTY